MPPDGLVLDGAGHLFRIRVMRVKLDEGRAKVISLFSGCL